MPDKGVDRIFVFRFHDGKLVPDERPQAVAREGAGPRHVAFHPARPWVYSMNELDSTVTACTFDASTGALQPFKVLGTLSDRFTGNSRAAEIEIDAAGRSLYASNRGEDTIAVFSIDPATGRLALVQTMPSGGSTPRFFALTPCGRWLYALNEDSDAIAVLSVDAESGRLADTGLSSHCGSPVCLVFGVTGPARQPAGVR